MTTANDPLPELIFNVRHKSPAVRLGAVKALAKLGGLAREAIPALTAAVNDPEGKVREAAAAAVGAVGPEALTALTGLLQHADKYVRRNAVWGLGKLGPAARPAVPQLSAALKDEDPRTAGGAAQALGAMGIAAADAVPPLAEAMRGTNIVLCRLAAKALSQIGRPALPTLVLHLKHHDPFVRSEAAVAVGWIGPSAAGAVLPLLDLLTNVRGSARNDTPSPLTSLTPPTGIAGPPVDAPANGADNACRANVAQALGRIGAAAAVAVAALERTAMSDPNPGIRDAAKLSARQIRTAVAGDS